MVARFEDVRPGVGKARADGYAAAQALGQGHHVRRDAVVLVREPAAGPAETGLNLVEDQQDVLRVAPLAHAPQVARRRRDDADLPHYGLEHHSDCLAGGCGLDGVEVVISHMHESAGQRPERIGVFLLAAGGHRRQRASVKGAGGGDDLERTVAVPGTPLPRDLDRSLIGLGAGVAEEDPRRK